MNAIALQDRLISAFCKTFPQGRKAACAHYTARARFNKDMQKLGFDSMAIYRAYRDCCDMAELMLSAEAA